MSNVISQGAVVAVIGICTVFTVLAILWGVLEIMRVVFTAKKEKPAASAAPAPAPAQAPAPVAMPAEDDSELIAVLTAAIAASLNQTTTYNLKIKSYRRVDAGVPVWNRTARRDNLIG